jgi:hypothetical protein
VEIDGELAALVDQECERVPQLARQRVDRRLQEHREFLAEFEAAGGGARHSNRRYAVAVVTSQETDLVLDRVQSITREAAGEYRVRYEEADEGPAEAAAT